ncbi:hemoblobin-interacting domain-containing protein [Paenibacillus koleovorans]|uniref:hemoblobin-interacting domain-containing protein n=1 Tax=Paenibacillus koleovorans TaxID=121608 RepID=UPI000FD9784D|nr:S-layer homology domain-containing protein [Paenibacillus koleovorans]
MRREGIQTLCYKAALMILAMLLIVAGIPGLMASNGAKAKADDAAAQGWLEVGETGFSGAARLYVYNGTPYVAYSDKGNDNKATVKRHDGSGWVTVGSAGFSAGAASGIALQVYGGTPYVAFSDGGNGYKATVMKYDGSKWVTVGNAGSIADQSAIFSFSVYNGSPYVAYSSDGNDWKAVVMKYDGSDWSPLGGAASANSVDTATFFVNEGKPYVAYSDNNGAAVVKTFDGSDWVTVGRDTNVSDGRQANGISLYMYKGTPYVAYGDYDDVAEVTKAVVKKYDSTSDSWVSVGDAGADSSSEMGTSLFIYNGTPYVAYTEDGRTRRGRSGPKAVVRMYDGDEWTTLSSNGLTAGRISSFYVSNGTPYAAIWDSENGVATVMSYGNVLPAPTLIADDAADADLTHDIKLTFADDAAWRGAIKTVTAGTAKLRAGTDYTVGAGTITIKAGVLSEGDNDVTVKAAGYSNVNLVQPVRGFSQTGTEQDPFLIATAGQLHSVRNHLASGTYFKLTADIDLGLYQAGGGWLPIGDNDSPFEGVFEGDGHTITNLTISRNSSYAGLFGSISLNGTVSNIHMDHVTISGESYVGGLAGQNDGTIVDSHVAGSVKGTSGYLGGLVGYSKGQLSGSSATGTVTVTAGGGYAGGLVGKSEGSISGSYSTATVIGTGSIGGLVGMSQGPISGSYATGDVTSSSNGVGGLVGYSQGAISGSYATGSVRGYENVGGLVGIHESNISDSFSTGSVAGSDYVGGLVGSAASFQINRAYATGSVTGSGSYIGGLLGSKGGGWSLYSVFYDIETTGQTASAGNYGYGQDQPTANMKTLQLYTEDGHSWDFNGVWGIDSSRNNGYPYLQALVHDAVAPVIGTQPEGGTVFQYSGGPTLNTQASVSDGGTLSYQWFSHTSDSNSGGTPIDAATGAFYRVPTETAGTAYYYVAVTNTSSRATGSQTATTKSNAVAVTVNASASSPTVTADSTNADLSHTIELTFADDAAWRGAITSITIETPSTMTGTLVAGRDYTFSPGMLTLAAGVLSQGNNTVRVKATGYADATSLQAVAGFSQTGTEQDPYLIATAGQLDSIRNNLNPGKYFKLTADIDLSVYESGSGWMPIGDGILEFFNGTFKGNGYKISNLNINRPYLEYVGLLAFNSWQGTVANVGLENVNVTGKQYVGGLAGHNAGTVETSYAEGKVSGTSNVGGLTGSNGGQIRGSYAAGEVVGTLEFVGGLVGRNYSTIAKSFALSNVTGNQFVGGLAGSSHDIFDTFAKGSVKGTSYVGGLVGYFMGDMMMSFSASNSYAVGRVTGTTFVGGLVGHQGSGKAFQNSFYDTETTGQASSAGSNANGQAPQKQTSTSMRTSALYTAGGWDFGNVWMIDPRRNNGYPYLPAWQTDTAAPSIDTQPQDATVLVGATSPVLQVTASVSEGGALSYQWYKNTTSGTSGGTLIEDAISSVYEAPTTHTGTTYYYAVVTSTNNLVTGLNRATATSQAAAVTVNALSHAEIPTILAQPVNRIVSQNSPNPSLSVTATVYDGGVLSYQWYSNSVDSASEGTAIEGASLATYEAPATVVGATYYYAVVTNTNNNATGLKTAKATSSVASVVVNPAPIAPTAPQAPTGLAAFPGDGIVSLVWTAVSGTVTYNVYQGTSAGAYGSSPAATVSGATYYTATGLTNGVTYYFAVTASDAGGTSAFSSDVSATPQAPAPGAPTLYSPIVGNGTATLNWSAVSGASGYKIYRSTSSGSYGAAVATVSGSVYSYLATGLTNGVTYYLAVKATNDGGDSPASNEVVAMPIAPSPPITTPTDPEPQPQPPQQTDNKSSEIYVNGKPESAGTATTTKVNDQTVTTVTLDQKKLLEKLAAESDRAIITVPVNTKSDVVIAELNGQIVKSLEDKQAVLEIKTEQATYTLPALQINIQAVSEQLGQGIALQDIKVTIEIAVPPADTVKIATNSAEKGGFSIEVPPLNFSVKGTYGDKTIEIAKFNTYVERTIAIPDGVDPKKITTGIVVEPDGTVRHVPTQIVVIDGKYYAKINSLTNSTYSLVSHTRTFSDVKSHWAERAVNDMGSRMIIEGVGPDVFKPDQDITRAEFAAIVVRGLGLKLESGAVPFSDVKASDWYNGAVRTAYEYRLISGFEDGTFRPNDKITREQAMVVIARAMALTKLSEKLPSGTLLEVLRPFADANQASNWAQASIAASLQAGLISGRSATELAPKANITRAEVAAIIQRLLQKSNLI